MLLEALFAHSELSEVSLALNKAHPISACRHRRKSQLYQIVFPITDGTVVEGSRWVFKGNETAARTWETAWSASLDGHW